MNIIVTSLFVDDQQKALDFYTKKLNFEPKLDIPLGEHRWLTVTGPGRPDGVELVLEPSGHPAVAPFRKAMAEDGIPMTMFGIDDCEAEYSRLCALGVVFTQPPTDVGSAIIAVFDDTCGNLIQIAQLK